MNVVRESADKYDKSMLDRIGSEPSKGSLTRNPNVPPRNFLPAPVSRPLFDSHRRPNKPSPLSVPNGPSFLGSSPIDPPLRWPGASSASPEQPSSYRSPTADTDGASPCAADAEHNGERTLRRSGSSSIFGSPDDTSSMTSRSNRGSYDHGVMEDADMDDQVEETGLKNLNIGSSMSPYSPGSKSGLKRRASSPPGEDGVTASPRDSNKAKNGLSSLDIPSGGSPDPYRRAALYPPVRFHAGQGSVSSSSSPRNGSYASSGPISLAGTSVTNVSSYDRLSPSGGVSPFSDLDVGHSPQYTTSPRNQLPRTSNHSRTASETKSGSSNRKMSSDSTGHTKHHSMPKLSGVFICECCPKKPKKFDSAEELQMHENEKQYECHYCHNRFKNKNEAERHQNSLHLRRHSWSCAALAGVEAAFHPSTAKLNMTDVCGYCGEEFPNPPNWDLRFDHLTTVHKYGECNKTKKFFRADHFRQHLKHSHAGTSGKWTNMLENACMKDEPPPEPLVPGERRNLTRASVISEEEPPDQ
ncbi:hypothetical protein GP486_008375 [Trichoglossum hirsutum]|uniref:C2H2-type domain-containing protein n=1 Tax=Trichoglossum hirsutum TaxID=265104 RepID=A0A9P8IE36_9PEZI|nr:hypothetical protein GP486_008375 [Trichoglossum hirsutum]